MQLSEGDIEVWAGICSLRHNWTVSAGQKGGLTNDRGGDGTLLQGPRQHLSWCSPSESALMICTGQTKMTLFPLSGEGKKSISLPPTFLFPCIGERSSDVTSLFADILFAAGCIEGLLFFRVCETPKYLHAESQLHSMGRKTSKAWVQNSGFIGLCNHPRSFLVPLRLWRCVCVFGRTDF